MPMSGSPPLNPQLELALPPLEVALTNGAHNFERIVELANTTNPAYTTQLDLRTALDAVNELRQARAGASYKHCCTWCKTNISE